MNVKPLGYVISQHHYRSMRTLSQASGVGAKPELFDPIQLSYQVTSVLLTMGRWRPFFTENLSSLSSDKLTYQKRQKALA